MLRFTKNPTEPGYHGEVCPAIKLFVSRLRGEPGDGFEAADLAGRAVAAVGRFLYFLWRALFSGVEEIIEGASDLYARLAVGELEPEARGGERRRHAEEEQRVLDPGEHEQHGERRPEYAPERKVFSALVG
jgi:hypothetical protein